MTLPRRFENRVGCSPDAVAVSFVRPVGSSGETRADLVLSYAELNARANRWAQHLIRLGIGPEQIVGVAVERSVEMLVVLLATLKTGAAYLPLDPALPEARLVLMIADARPSLVLASQASRHRLPESSVRAQPSVRVLAVDSAATRRLVERCSDQNPAGSTAGAQLAYVIYTSGSTGVPKGVAITHGALTSFMDAMADALPLEPGDRLLAVSTITFDISVLELFQPLCHGAEVLLVTRDDARDPARLLLTRRVDVLQATPTHWKLLLGLLDEDLPALRMLTGGEALPKDLARAMWKAGGGGAAGQILNLYGPTETTLWATTRVLTEVDRTEAVVGASAMVSLGEPLAGYLLSVFGPGLEPVEVGQAGEFVIGGVTLARGYLGRPGLTAERFVPDPRASSVSGGRLYRTGDLGRQGETGWLEFLGRVDHQVKIRGFRIELGEIEAVLSEHEDVAHAVLMARDQAAGDPRLIAFVVPSPGTSLETAILREHLARRLPDYMMPAVFVALQTLPLTPSGKADRVVLACHPLPDAGFSPDISKSVASTVNFGEEVKMLCDLYSEILPVGDVAVSADAVFMELGGHSLHAAQVVTRVRQVFGLELPLRVVFRFTKVAELAEEIHRLRKAGARPEPPGCLPWAGFLEPASGFQKSEIRKQTLALGPLALGQWRFWRQEHQLIYTLKFEGELATVALERAIREIRRRHQVLRSRFFLNDGEPCQEVLPDPVADDTIQVAQPWSNLAAVLHSARRPFDQDGPFFRARLWHRHDTEHWLLLSFDHIAFDGGSWPLFQHELRTLYGAFSQDDALGQGVPSPLAELPLQFIDYARRQTESTTGRQQRTAAVAFWRRRLRDLPRYILPALSPVRPALSDASFLLDEQRLEALMALAQAEEASLQMVLLTAYQVLLYRLTGNPDMMVKVAYSGRDDVAVHGLIGSFARDLVVRRQLARDATLREVLRLVRDEVFEAFHHSEICLSEQRAAIDVPAGHEFSFHFQLVLGPEAGLLLPGLTMEEIDTPDQGLELREGIGPAMSPNSPRQLFFGAGPAVGAESMQSALRLNLRGHFDPEPMQKLALDLEQLIAELIADPDQGRLRG